MTDAGRGIIDLDVDDDKVKRKLKGLDKGVGQSGSRAGSSFGSGFTRSVGSSLAGLGRIVATAGATAAVGLGAVVAAAGGWGLKIAADNETAAVSFKLLLGSAEKSEAFLKRLQDFAAKTPLEFPDVREAASRLLAVGTSADSVIPILETLGDATAAAGSGSEGLASATRALTQVQQKGKVSAEEILQLAEAGVPAWEGLAEVLGTDVAGAQKAVSDGTVTAAQLFEAIETKAGPALQRTTGLLAVQGETLTGLLSTLKDTVGQNLGKQLAPLADAIKVLLPDITELAGGLATSFGGVAAKLVPSLIGVFSSLADVIGPVIESLGSGFVDVFAGLGGAISGAAPAIADFFEVFSKLGGVIGPLLFIVGALISEGLEQLSPVFDAIIEAVKPLIPILGGALIEALKTMRPLWPVFADAIEKLAPLIAELAGALGKELVGVFETLLPILIDNAPAMVEMAEAMIDLLIAVLPIVGPLAKLAGLFVRLTGLELLALAKVIGFLADAIGFVTKFDFAGAWGKITDAVSGFARTVGEQLPKVVTFFKELPGKVIGALSDIATKLIPAAYAFTGGFLLGMVKRLPFLIGFMVGLPFKLIGALINLQQVLIPKAIAFIAGFLVGMARKLPALITFMIELPGKLVGKLVDLATKLIPKGVALLGGLLQGIKDKLPSVLDFVGGLPGKLIGAIGRLGKLLVQAGKNLIEGLWNGVKDFDIIGKIKDFAGGIVKGFTSALGIGSPSTVMAIEVGKPIAEGIEQGYRNASRPLSAPIVDQAAISALTSVSLPFGALNATASGTTVNMNGDNFYSDDVDIDRVLFKLGFRLAAA